MKASWLRRCRTTRNVFGEWFYRSKTILGLLSIVVFATGCVSPSPSGEVVNVAVYDIQQGKAETGLPVRWGGTIVGVENKPDVTVLQIVSRPLLRSGRPQHNDKTDGRFLAEIQEFLDPEIITIGRDITLVGTVGQVQQGRVGQADYRFPVLSVFDYRLWKTASEIEKSNVYPYYYPDDRYWHEWPHRRRSDVWGQIRF